MATRISAAASIATIGARKKRLDALSKDHILLLLQILASNEYGSKDCEGSHSYASNSTKNLSKTCLMPHLLLQEHITAIIVYTALSGDPKKQLLIDAGTTPILVGVLRVSFVHFTIFHCNSNDLHYIHSTLHMHVKTYIY